MQHCHEAAINSRPSKHLMVELEIGEQVMSICEKSAIKSHIIKEQLF